MPYNSNEGYIYVGFNSSTQKVEGVDIRDIMQATGCGVADIGYIIQNGSINPMAKYKPVRHSQLQNLPLSYAQRVQAKHGLSTTIPTINTGAPNTSAPWEYLRPQGGTGSPYRYTDFAKDSNPNIGYDARATAPFAFGVEGPSIDKTTGNGGVGFPLYANSGVNAWLSQQGGSGLWHEDRSLSIQEIMDGRSFENAYIGFSIVDMSESGYPHVDIVFNKKFTEISSSGQTVWVTSESKDVNGKWCPKVRLFADDRGGHTFRFIAFLHEGFTPPSDGKTYSYYILSPNGTGDNVFSLANTVSSLAMMAGMDRYDTVVYRRDTINFLICNLVTTTGLTMTMVQGDEGRHQWNGGWYRKYRLTGMVYGNIHTPNNWTLNAVRTYVYFYCEAGFVSNTNSPTDSGSGVVNGNYEKEGYVNNMTAPNHDYNSQALMYNNVDTYVHVYESAVPSGSYVRVTAKAVQPTGATDEVVSFDGIYTVTPT